MKRNLGPLDKTIRILISAEIFVLFLTKNITGPIGYLLFGIGILLVFTTIVGTCPLYLSLKLSTYSSKEQPR